MQATLTVLAALAWLVSAMLWWWAARAPVSRLPEPTTSLSTGAYAPFDTALQAVGRKNTHAASAAMVAALLQAVASVVR